MKLIDIIDRIEKGDIIKVFYDTTEDEVFTYDSVFKDYYDDCGCSLTSQYQILCMLNDDVETLDDDIQIEELEKEIRKLQRRIEAIKKGKR